MPLPPGRATNEPSNYFAFGRQKGVNEEASTFYFTKHLSGTGFDVQTDYKAERIGGGGREVGLIYKTMVKADGSLVTYGWPDGVARMFSNALGTDNVTIQATNPLVVVKHQFVPGVATLPYMTIEQNWADETERTYNCLVSELKVEGQQGQPIRFTMPFISGGTVQAVAPRAVTPARESGTPFMYPGASAALEIFAGGPAETNSPTTSEITKFAFTIKNTIDESIQTLALTRTDAVWENVDFNLDGTVKYVDRKMWNAVNYFGGSNVSISLATAAFNFFAVQSSSATYSMHLQVPILVIGSSKVNRLDPDGKTMYMDFSGLTQAGPTSAVIAELVTGATTAYTLPTT